MTKKKSLIRSLWRRLPDNALKDHARVLYHNLRNKGRYGLRRDVYSTSVGGVVVRSKAHPFGLPAEIAAYEARYTPEAGSVIIDAGSFDGQLAAYWAARIGASGRIIAIEPDPENAAVVCETLQLNGVRDQVQLITRGLWDALGEVSFHSGGGVGSSAFYAMPGSRPNQIQVMTLDDLADELKLNRLDLIKMDIEGSEVRALLGAKQCLARFRPRLAIAAGHQIEGCPSLPRVLNLMHDLNYSTEVLQSDEPIVHGIPND